MNLYICSMIQNDSIIALATPSGIGAISVIRISGEDAINILSKFFRSKSGKLLKNQKSHTIHLGNIVDNSRVIDEVLVSVFKNPRSYTCLLYTSPSPRDAHESRMPSSA